MKRASLVLLGCVVLFVAAGFAATGKSERHRNRLADCSDGSLRNGDLLDTRSSVSGGDSGFQLGGGYRRSGAPNPEPISSPDNWNGGAGNWSNAGNWNNGVPGAGSDVTIYSGGNDTVTLDVSATINSLALGGPYGEGSSELRDNGVKQELSINQGLTVGGGGYLDLTGGSTVSAGADSSNAGRILLSNGSTLAITGNLTITAPSGGFGLVDLENGSVLTVSGDVNNSGALATNQFGNGGGNTLNITGTLTNGSDIELAGPGDRATLGGFINSPFSNTVVINGSTLQINGNASNSYGLYIGAFGPGNDTLNITGTLTNTNCCLSSGGVNIFSDSKATIGGAVTNSGGFYVGTGSMATFGSGLTNSGTVDVDGGSTLQINGNASNSGALGTNFLCCGGTGNNTLNITGILTNTSGGSFLLYGPGDTATIGSVVNGGLIDLENGSALTVLGNVTNSGDLYTSFYSGSGNNTITIDGTLTVSPGSQVELFNPTDRLIVNGGIQLLNGAALSTPTLNNGGTINIDGLSTLLVGMQVLHGPITNYTQLANGTLGEMISATSFGVINVNGSALLDGTLAILLQGGFNPSVGSTYKFLNFTPGELSGIFADIENDIFNGGTEKWMVDYDNADGYVELIAENNGAPVPEPATLLVLIPGLLGAGYGLRRRLMM